MTRLGRNGISRNGAGGADRERLEEVTGATHARKGMCRHARGRNGHDVRVIERFKAILFDAGGVLVLPDPTVLGPLLAYFGGDPSVSSHRRAHYAGMAAKSRCRQRRGLLGRVRPLLRAQRRRAGGRRRRWRRGCCSGTRNAYLWRWPIPESRAWHCRSSPPWTSRWESSRTPADRSPRCCRAVVCASRGTGPHTPMRVIVDSHIVGVAKPDPEIFDHALGYFDGIARGDIAYIGDSVTMDIGAARAAGLHPILLDPYDDHPDADFERIHSLLDLVEDGHSVSRSWSRWRADIDLDEYYTRWQRLEANGQSAAWRSRLHRVARIPPASWMPAAAWVGSRSSWLDVVSTSSASISTRTCWSSRGDRAADPVWIHADLATMRLDRQFDVVAMPGNVMIFCRPSDRSAIIHNAAAHLRDDGVLVAGFDHAERTGRADTRGVRRAVCGERPGAGPTVLDVAGRRLSRRRLCGVSASSGSQASHKRRAMTLRHSVSSAPSKMLRTRASTNSRHTEYSSAYP